MNRKENNLSCENCNSPFVSMAKNASYCSHYCRKEARRQRDNESGRNRNRNKSEYMRLYRMSKPEKFKLYEERIKLNRVINSKPKSVKIYVKECPITKQLFTTRDKNRVFINSGVARSYIATNTNTLTLKKKCRECGTEYNGNKTSSFCKKCASNNKKVSIYNSKLIRRHKYKLGDKIDREIVYSRYKYCCANCGVNTFNTIRGLHLDNEPTLDHIIPLSKGGTHTYDNVQLLCRKCNVNKSDSIPIGHLKSLAYALSQTAGHQLFSIRNV